MSRRRRRPAVVAQRRRIRCVMAKEGLCSATPTLDHALAARRLVSDLNPLTGPGGRNPLHRNSPVAADDRRIIHDGLTPASKPSPRRNAPRGRMMMPSLRRAGGYRSRRLSDSWECMCRASKEAMPADWRGKPLDTTEAVGTGDRPRHGCGANPAIRPDLAVAPRGPQGGSAAARAAGVRPASPCQ
jgi:hypothetical protein